MGSRVLSLRGDNAPLDEWADQLVVVTTEQRAPAGTADFGHTKSGSQEIRRWREMDSNHRFPDRGQHFSRRETSSIPYPLTTRWEIVHQAKSG
jgi:hypothetical protein